jgi:hypothetical protein
LVKGWTVMDRLGEIHVPTLVMAGRSDFLFPVEHQVALAAGIPNARLEIIECAGHNPQEEQTEAVIAGIRRFWAEMSPGYAKPASAAELQSVRVCVHLNVAEILRSQRAAAQMTDQGDVTMVSDAEGWRCACATPFRLFCCWRRSIC